METKQKLNIKDYLKPKSFQTVKETNTTINRQPLSWEETLAIILLEKSPRRYVNSYKKNDTTSLSMIETQISRNLFTLERMDSIKKMKNIRTNENMPNRKNFYSVSGKVN